MREASPMEAIGKDEDETNLGALVLEILVRTIRVDLNMYGSEVQRDVAKIFKGFSFCTA